MNTDGVDPDDIVAVPLRHPWRWVVAALLLATFVTLAVSLWENENVHHPTISEFLFNPRILSGVVLTLVITVDRDGRLDGARRADCRHAALEQPGDERAGLVLCVGFPRHAAADPDRVLGLPGPALRADFARRSVHRLHRLLH